MGEQRQVRFAVDKHGRLRAWRWCCRSGRFFPMSVEVAKAEIATGAAREIPKVKGDR